MITDYSERHIAFDGCFNFRDIGGYPTSDGRTVKWGRYYRTGRQDRMTADDKARLQSLGVKTQIDLRMPDEAAEQGPGPLADMGAAYHNIPVIPQGGTTRLSELVGDTGISGKRYLGYLEFGPDSWLRIFELFKNADSQAIVLHCTAGKDRTGVSTAFLLSVLGVNRELIEADYKLTNIDVPRQVDFLEANIGLPEGMDRNDMSRAAGVPEDAMADFLDGLETRHGGAISYLKGIGITEQDMEAVRAAFL